MQTSSLTTLSSWCMNRSANTPSLFNPLWYRGELACLFADADTGKSFLAVQIAEHIAHSEPVIYWDTKFNPNQFVRRYLAAGHGSFTFHPNLLHAAFNPSQLAGVDPKDHLDTVIESIDHQISKSGAKILVIDNINTLCSGILSTLNPRRFVQQLHCLKIRHNLSILVVASVPRAKNNRPLDQADLQKARLSQFDFDSIFAIGRCNARNDIRYIKQLKSCYGPLILDHDHSLMVRLESEDGFLHFHRIDTQRENVNLDINDIRDWQEINARIIELRMKKWTQLDIAKELNISVGKVNKTLQMVKDCPYAYIDSCTQKKSRFLSELDLSDFDFPLSKAGLNTEDPLIYNDFDYDNDWRDDRERQLYTQTPIEEIQKRTIYSRPYGEPEDLPGKPDPDWVPTAKELQTADAYSPSMPPRLLYYTRKYRRNNPVNTSCVPSSTAKLTEPSSKIPPFSGQRPEPMNP